MAALNVIYLPSFDFLYGAIDSSLTANREKSWVIEMNGLIIIGARAHEKKVT